MYHKIAETRLAETDSAILMLLTSERALYRIRLKEKARPRFAKPFILANTENSKPRDKREDLYI